ncbi:MAG: acetolactate synthase large subunit [Alphaproteobacteria bacterium]
MNGAEALIKTLVANGVRACFANPGTSEMHFVAALDRVPEMRGVLCLFEGVATGAADGYARLTGMPAATLLHLGPGLANGLANLHNARRARVPVVNVVGEHAGYHKALDAPLTSDIEGFARPVSGWIRTSRSTEEVGADAAAAVAASLSAPGQVATLILPADTAWTEGGRIGEPIAPTKARAVARERVAEVAAALKTAKRLAFLLNGQSVRKAALEHAGAIAAATGARLFCDTFVPRLERGAGIVPVTRLPYFGEQVIEALAGTDILVTVETSPPVAFFAYPDKPGELTPPGTHTLRLALPSEDGPGALAALADLVGAKAKFERQALTRPEIPKGALTVGSAGAVIGALLPEGTVVVDESITAGIAVFPLAQGAPPHDWLQVMGGSIGEALPMAVGAAIGAPDRKILCLSGDGSAMYTLQALWTMAREKLDIVNVIFNNGSYVILNFELMRMGAQNPARALSMLDLKGPALDWVDLARGMGVEATRAERGNVCRRAAECASLARAAPHRGDGLTPRVFGAVIPDAT